jgi:hypothetical protein
MKTLYCFSIASVIALLLFQSPAAAAVISRDWKTPGDGLLTYDDANQREWLDLTESRLSMFQGATLEQRFQNAVSQLAPGNIFAGFAVATSRDLTTFANSAGIDASTSDFGENSAPISTLIALVSSTVANPAPGTDFSIGLLNELRTSPTSGRLMGQFYAIPSSGRNGEAGLLFSTEIEPFQTSGFGVWMFREVPEPRSLSIAIPLAILFIARRVQMLAM